MTVKLLPALILLAFAAPVAGSPGSVRDFQLPPAATPTARPQVQGPVDTEGAVPVGPRVIPTAQPSQAPTAAATAEPETTSSQEPTRSARPQRTPARSNAAPSTVRRPAPEPSATRATQVEANTAPSTDPTTSAPQAETTNLPTTTGRAVANPTQGTQGSGNWLWWIASLGGLILLGAGGFLLWRKREAQAEIVPQIELPLVSPAPESGEIEADEIEAASPAQFTAAKTKFQVKVEVQSLSRSVMNATLQYSLELQNLGSAAVEEISISADVVTAHGKAPVSEQLTDAASELPFATFVAGVASRSAEVIDGEFRLPLGTIKTITQGSTKLFVPLLRLKIEAEDIEPIIQTFVIGIKPPSAKGKLLPFRLDEMAQTYRNIGVRQLS